nr:chorismate mutase 2 [Ipomoea batatas]
MGGSNNGYDHGGVTLETVRTSLIRQEDTIVFCLIERAKFPRNPTLYDQTSPPLPTTLSGSLFHFIFKETEALQSKVGRYLSAEENPFFPDDVPESLVPAAGKFEPFLHPVADCINVNEKIWDVYLNQLLPLVAVEGDDGNYALTAATDIHFLQALSRRIHYGKFVAEVKFREAPDDYTPAIRAKVYIYIYIFFFHHIHHLFQIQLKTSSSATLAASWGTTKTTLKLISVMFAGQGCSDEAFDI